MQNSPQIGTRANHRPPEFGFQLNIVHIAHCERTQIVFNQQQLAWGTIYELARGVTRGMWTFEDMTEHRLRQLKGSNVQAAWKVAAVIKDEMRPTSAMRAPAEIWLEYDREQLAIVENKGRGLGTMGDWEGKENWYGGKIQQVARIVRAGSSYKLELEKPEIRRSHRFARFLGSRRILQIRVPDNLTYDTEVPKFLESNKFVLCGRVFVPFHAKEGSAYLFETNENIDRQTNPGDGDDHRLTLHEFVQWHNPLRLNSKQPTSKWSTRWALGLSTSVPTIKFSSENIFFINDQCSISSSLQPMHPVEKIMTDGCGFINGAALTAIMRVIQYPSRPTAVQGRIAGAKGMWVLHPDPEYQVADGPPKIWIRNSQNKINCGPLHKVDAAHRIFDLVAPSRVTGPSRLSRDTLVNLTHNNVPTGILKELMADGLHNEVRQLTEWNGPDSMLVVWRAVERAGRVVTCRLRRRIAGQARAFGLGQLRPNEELSDEIDDDDIASDQPLAASDPRSRNPHSGQPTSLHESVLELLQAGFHPLKLDLLFRKLQNVVTLVLDDYIKNCHIPVKESLEAYIIPDPYGVLEEGQIHFRSSQHITDPESGTHMDVITGPVLVWRNPTRLPSDVQKVTAVSHPKLASYFDVIIFPVKGKRSLASYLGGGDTVVLVWSKSLVPNFNTAPLCETPVDLRNDFEREVEHLLDFDQRVSKLSDKEAQTAFQRVLLLGLAETKRGLYSGFHDAACFKFTTCLDASKTGLRVKHHVFEADRKYHGGGKPYYKVAALKKSDSPREDPPLLKRRISSSFILDDLVDEGNRLRNEFGKKYLSLRSSSPRALGRDPHLTSPYTSASYRATQAVHVGFQGLRDNLTVAKKHVDKVYQDWLCAIAIQKSASSPGCSSDPKEQQIQKAVQYFARQPLFEDVLFFSVEELKTIMASYAYTLSESFGFSVAFTELCAIKARIHGGGVLFEDKFAQVMNIPNNVLRALSQAQDGIDD
ncbi:RNA dependent RNA polymerase-domain-containing protein [Suillus spraguei]|nr:RNA dependent RNA polymerase-domain-containing protein [Suillus spraguei]